MEPLVNIGILGVFFSSTEKTFNIVKVALCILSLKTPGIKESKFKPDWAGKRNETTKPSQVFSLFRLIKGAKVLKVGFYVTLAGLELIV